MKRREFLAQGVRLGAVAVLPGVLMGATVDHPRHEGAGSRRARNQSPFPAVPRVRPTRFDRRLGPQRADRIVLTPEQPGPLAAWVDAHRFPLVVRRSGREAPVVAVGHGDGLCAARLAQEVWLETADGEIVSPCRFLAPASGPALLPVLSTHVRREWFLMVQCREHGLWRFPVVGRRATR